MRYLTGIAATLLIALAPLAATAAPEAQQRERFKAAYERMQAGQEVDYRQLSTQLDGYPLAPYLDYYRLRGRLTAANDADVVQFLEQHGDLPVAGLLRHAWLVQLGRRGNWSLFDAHYDGSRSAELRCHSLQAQSALNKQVDEAWLTEARDLWLVGRSQPKACDPVFASLRRHNGLSPADAWHRVELAMETGNTSLASYLGRYLTTEDRRWLEHWLAADRQPLNALRRPAFDPEHPRGGQLLAHAVTKAAQRNLMQAWEALPRLSAHGSLSAEQFAELQRTVALRAAVTRRSEALAMLNALPEAAVDDEVRHWRAIFLRGEQDWERLVAAIAELGPTERGHAEWRYWNAYALERLGERTEARRLYTELAQERNYYGFLAADAVGAPYNMSPEPVTYRTEDLVAVAARPGVQRALELFKLGLLVDARREWQAALAEMSPQQVGHAAVVAANAGWYDRAIISANQAGLHNALELRFPMAFRDRLEYHSRKQQIELPLAFALLRKESAFMPDAVSSAGALGLMQVMPQTGREVARGLNQRFPSSQVLLDVDTNLLLGSAYLRQVLDRFHGNPILAAAAYNAGPHRVDTWLERNADQPPALWVENISFRETRQYVKDILAFSAVFDWQLNNNKPRRITDLMYNIRETESTACSTTVFTVTVC